MNQNDGCPGNAGNSPQNVTLFALFTAFFRVGLTAFGGPAMIPHIRKLVVERHAWIAEKDFRLGLSICQVIPGATVMQLAAYVGLRLRGLTGSLTAFCGFGLPAFLLIVVLSWLYFQYQDFPVTISAFAGLKVIVLAIILNATIDFSKKYIQALPDVLIAAGAAFGILTHIHPALIILAAMLIGIAIYKDTKEKPHNTATNCNNSNGKNALRLGASLAALLVILWLVSSDLFWLTFRMMRIDLFAFGGGFAALPVMLHEVVTVSGWLSEKTFLDGIALGQITPGPIVITAAFVGFAIKGLLGAMVATIGIFSPSILMLVWAVPHCDRLLGSKYFQRAMRASLATLDGLMAATVVALAMPIGWNISGILLGLCAFIALRFKTDILWVVLVGAVASLVLL